MKKLLSLLSIIVLYTLFATQINAVEPPESVYLNDFFKLYRFLPPQEMQLYESQDMARKDIGQTILEDSRPPQGSECKLEQSHQCEGRVVLENEESPGHIVQQILPHEQGTCRSKDKERTIGYCDYLKKPDNTAEVTAVDYSKSHDLVFCKLQNRFCSYWHNGGANKIAWGADNLSVAPIEQYARRAITLGQAADTQDTLEATKEWPVGGVSWDTAVDGEDPTSDKAVTLIKTWQSLEDDADGQKIKFDAKLIRAEWDDLVNPPPPGTDMTNLFHGEARQDIYQIITKNLAKPVSEQPKWLQYFLKTPECGPGYDKGYVLVSVCADGSCTLPPSSDEQFINQNPKSRNQTLYSAPNMRQNLCAAVYNVYQTYTLSDAQNIMREATKRNPLLPYTLSSSTKATPTRIIKHLTQTLSGDMVKNQFFSLMWFHKIIDGWRSPDGGFWFVKIGYEIKRGGEYRGAGAIEDSSLYGVIVHAIKAILDVFVDMSYQGLHHKVLIPSLAAHSIDAIENATQIITQTSTQNKIDAEASVNYNNGVQAGAEVLPVGNNSAPKISQGRLALWLCRDPLFSSSWATKIVDYIFGGRVDCNGKKIAASPPTSTPGTPGTATCKTDTPDGVSKDAASAAAKVGAKYNIPAKWLEAMYVYEGGAKKLGDACKEEGGVNVVGPLQIATGTYKLVACKEEQFSTVDQEKAQCSDSSKLSRCSLEGSFELAARVLLQQMNIYGGHSGAYDCTAQKSEANLTQLYRATNAYSGCGSPGGKPYAQYICEYAGNCPSPLPPIGTAITCVGN